MAYTRARTSRIRSVCMGDVHYGTQWELSKIYDDLARAETDPDKRQMYLNHRENYVRDDGCYTN